MLLAPIILTCLWTILNWRKSEKEDSYKTMGLGIGLIWVTYFSVAILDVILAFFGC